MKLAKGDKTMIIPTWAVVMGLIVVDSMVTNVLKVVDNHNMYKAVKNQEKGS